MRFHVHTEMARVLAHKLAPGVLARIRLFPEVHDAHMSLQLLFESEPEFTTTSRVGEEHARGQQGLLRFGAALVGTSMDGCHVMRLLVPHELMIEGECCRTPGETTSRDVWDG